MNFGDSGFVPAERSGVAGKTAQILMRLAGYGTQGVRLKDLAEAAGIARPTVYRILQELAPYGLVRQSADKKYALGSTAYYLGLSAPQPAADTAQIAAVAQRLSDETGDTCYVAVKNFQGIYYWVRTSGSFPIRAQTVSAGDSVGYTGGYCGLALLAEQELPLRQAVLAKTAADNAAKAAEIEAAVQQYQTEKFLYGAELILPGVSGMACTVPVQYGRPFAAVSICAIESRLRPERAAQLLPNLKAAAAEIGSCFLQTEEK